MGIEGLVTNYGEGGGATKRKVGGGTCEVLPLQKRGGGGAENVLAILKGRHKMVWAIFDKVA